MHFSAQSFPEHTAISPTLRHRARRAAGRSSTAAKNTIPPRSPHPQAVGTPGKKRRRAGMTSGLTRYDVATAANEVILDKSMMCVAALTPMLPNVRSGPPTLRARCGNGLPIAPIASLACAPENGCNTAAARGTCRSSCQSQAAGMATAGKQEAPRKTMLKGRRATGTHAACYHLTNKPRTGGWRA